MLAVTLIERLPDDVKTRIIDITDVKLKTGKSAMRITFDIVLKPEQISTLKKNKKILNPEGICSHRYAPEIKHSYFYLLC